MEFHLNMYRWKYDSARVLLIYNISKPVRDIEFCQMQVLSRQFSFWDAL